MAYAPVMPNEGSTCCTSCLGARDCESTSGGSVVSTEARLALRPAGGSITSLRHVCSTSAAHTAQQDTQHESYDTQPSTVQHTQHNTTGQVIHTKRHVCTTQCSTKHTAQQGYAAHVIPHVSSHLHPTARHIPLCMHKRNTQLSCAHRSARHMPIMQDQTAPLHTVLCRVCVCAVCILCRTYLQTRQRQPPTP